MTELVHLSAAAGILTDSVAAAPVDQSGLTAVTGPGTTPLGTFADAVRFGPGARAQLAAAPAPADRERFVFRVVFAARGTVTERQNLIESAQVPAVLWIEPVAGDATAVRVCGAVQTVAGSWRLAVADATHPIDQWSSVALVVDDDVVAVLDETAGVLLAATALPEATIAPAAGTSLSIGTLPDGTTFPFAGDLAAAAWADDVPSGLDALVDDWRLSPAGMIDAKRWTLPFDAGAPAGPPETDAAAQSTVRRFAGADIRYTADVGAAFEIHGAIRDEYGRLTQRALLGFPVSDEIAGALPTVRKNLFSHGAVYWTAATGAFPVFEELYVAYESVGEAALLGAPVAAEQAVAGGLFQRFTGGEIYLEDGTSTAFEVHGAILQAFHATGGVAAWGFPKTHELPIVRPGGGTDLGRYSRFANGTFFWSPATGAHVVYGAIADFYRSVGGPQGRLGFPTSDELDLPDAPGARYNTFERGAIAWYPDAGAMELAPLMVRIGTVDTKEDEGFGRGQNDLTIDVALLRDGVQVAGFQDVSDGQNIRHIDRDLAARIEPWPGRSYELRVDVHERDPEDRPRLGLWQKRLDAGNGWGLRENQGILNSGAFRMIKSITASVSLLPPPGGFTDAQRHWGTGNPSTERISRNTFAKAFPEVDSEPEWWDITDGIESIFYELVSKGLSANGNCMGFSAAGILAEKGSGIYQLPLDRFGSAAWASGLEEFINIRHQSQVGSEAIWAFVALFLSGNTHDPVDVFRMTRAAHAAGQDPVLCLAQDYDFSGAPHVVRPIRWNDTTPVWEIEVLDPNFTGGPRKVLVDPGANTFSYAGGSSYAGGEWSGGRLYFLPFHTFAGAARLPIWDALRLILGGTIAILGDGEAATGITTPEGENLLLTGEPSPAARSAGAPNGFVPVPDYARTGDPGRRVTDGLRIDDLRIDARFEDRLTPQVVRRLAKASGLLARARREPALHRRGPRGGHRRLRDELGGIDLGVVIGREALEGSERLHGGRRLRLDAIAFDRTPLVVAARDAEAAARQAVPAAESLAELPPLRSGLLALAARLPEGEERAAVVELASDAAPLGLLARSSFRGRLGEGLASEVGAIVKALYSDDFVLDTVAVHGDGGRIAIAHALREYVVHHDGRPGSVLRIAGQNLRTAANTLTVAPGTGRRVTVAVTNRVGLRGDVVQARFVDLPAESAAPLTLNVRPGIGRWELVGDALAGPAQAQVSGVIGGRRFGASYDLTLERALRIQLPLARDAARLTVATTSGLFADAVAVTRIQPN